MRPTFSELYPTFLGAYRTTHQVLLTNNQAANSRLVTLRNAHASNRIVVTRVWARVTQIGAFTAATFDQVIAWLASPFSADDTTNAATVGQVRCDLTFPASSAVLMALNTTAAAGMTGGTLTKIGAPLSILPFWFLASVPTSGPTVTAELDLISADTWPFVLQPGQGIVLENGNLLPAAASARVHFELHWEEYASQ
jgi:hypothetical protein